MMNEHGVTRREVSGESVGNLKQERQGPCEEPRGVHGNEHRQWVGIQVIRTLTEYARESVFHDQIYVNSDKAKHFADIETQKGL